MYAIFGGNDAIFVQYSRSRSRNFHCSFLFLVEMVQYLIVKLVSFSSLTLINSLCVHGFVQ